MKEKIKTVLTEVREKVRGKAGRIAVCAAGLASTMALPAFAEETGATSTPASGGLDSVVDSVSTLSILMSKVWEMMKSNPLLTLFLAVALIGIGVQVFRMIKGATGGGGKH